jgi:hypothetical protein
MYMDLQQNLTVALLCSSDVQGARSVPNLPRILASIKVFGSQRSGNRADVMQGNGALAIFLTVGTNILGACFYAGRLRLTLWPWVQPHVCVLRALITLC